MKNLKIVIISILILAFPVSPAISGGGATGGSTEITQFIQFISDLMSNAKVLTQGAKKLSKAMDHYERMRAQASSFKASVMNTFIDENVSELLQAIKTGQRASRLIRGISSDWANLKRGLMSNRDFDLQAIINQYARWDDANETLINNALKNNKIQYDEFDSEEKLMGDLKASAKSAKSRTQLLQTVSMVGMEQLRQMQKLRALIQSHIEMETHYRQIELQQKEMRRHLKRKLYKYEPLPLDGKNYLEGNNMWN